MTRLKRGVWAAGLMTLICSFAHAADLVGVVLLNEVGGPPVQGVAISAVGANPVKTGPSGQFRMSFPKLTAGAKVTLILNRSGMLVVNDIQLRHTLLAAPETEPLLLLLCKSSDRERWATTFYRLKGKQNVTASYETELKRLNNAKAASEKTLAQLRDERDQAMRQVNQFATQLARVNLEEENATYERALALFLNGKLDAALEVLSEEQLHLDAEAVRKLAEQTQSAREQVVDSYLLRGNLLAMKLRFEEAAQAYEDAVKMAPESFDAQFSLGRFEMDLNRFELARVAYTKALELARSHGHKTNIAKTLNNLGVLYHSTQRLREAEKAYLEALWTYRKLAADNPAAYLPHVATTLTNLGYLYRATLHLGEAETACQEALAIDRKLAADNPAAYLHDLATALNVLGLLYRDTQRLGEAEKAYQEALGIRRKLAADNPTAYLPDVAVILNNLGMLYCAPQRLGEAEKAYQEVLGTFRKLAADNPAAYLPYVARTLNNLGLLYRDSQRLWEAEKACQEAIGIQRKLAANNPAANLPDLATALSSLGLLYRDSQRMGEAEKAYQEALGIWRKLAEDNPAVYLPVLAGVLNQLGNLCSDTQRLGDAEKTYLEALGIRRKLVTANPSAYLPDLAVILTNLGALYRDTQRLEDAEKVYLEELGIRHKLKSGDSIVH